MKSMKFSLGSQHGYHSFLCSTYDTPQYIIIMANYARDLGVTFVLEIHHSEVKTKFVQGRRPQFVITA